jgi:lambda family phage portal protein
MSILNLFGNRKIETPEKTEKRRYVRSWKAANIDRLTNDWQTSSLSADGEVLGKLKTLRARGRDLWMNDDYAKKYIGMVSTNVIGSTGVVLQNKAIDFNGKLDERANKLVEDAFWKWGEKFCEVTGTMNWVGVQRLVAETAARDGEIFIRKIRNFDNPFKFSLQILEPDYCPDEYNIEAMNGGNVVVMGVEKNNWNKPIAYYFTAKHPGDARYLYVNQKYIRIPAEEIYHIFLPSRSNQTRGWSWLATAMPGLKMLSAYAEAEVVAARASACKMGWLTKEEGEDKYKGDTTNSEGQVVSEFEAGIIEELPAGLKFQGWDPQHPNSNFGQFHKDILRRVASGLEVSYNALANDLESTSYSSGRIGILEERDNWRKLQQWIISVFHQKVFEDWLDMALMTGQIPLPYAKFDKFNAATWHPRGFCWVDPEKDSRANVNSIEYGLKTRTEELAERGIDFNEHLQQLKAEKEAIEAAGLAFVNPTSQKGGQVIPEMTSQGDDNGQKQAD